MGEKIIYGQTMDGGAAFIVSISNNVLTLKFTPGNEKHFVGPVGLRMNPAGAVGLVNAIDKAVSEMAKD